MLSRLLHLGEAIFIEAASGMGERRRECCWVELHTRASSRGSVGMGSLHAGAKATGVRQQAVHASGRASQPGAAARFASAPCLLTVTFRRRCAARRAHAARRDRDSGERRRGGDQLRLRCAEHFVAWRRCLVARDPFPQGQVVLVDLVDMRL